MNPGLRRDDKWRKGGKSIMTSSALNEMEDRLRISLGALFLVFLQVSMLGFGGPIVWARRIIVERRGWLSDPEFADILSLCQFLPGPNVVSITVCIGAKFRGPAGALASLLGFIVIPWTVGFALGSLLLSYAHVGLLQGILHGIAAAAAGLIIATGLRLLLPHRRRPIALGFAALAFAGLAIVKLPLLIVVLGLAPLSIAMARPPRTAMT
jgi:chromate transporter